MPHTYDRRQMLSLLGGASVPAEMQGRSFRRGVEGHTPRNWRKSMYYRYWMHNTRDHHVPAHYGLRTDRWKLIYDYGKPLGMTGAEPPDTQPDWGLFDVRNDPREMHNLYHDPKYASLIKKLTELAERQREVGDLPVQ
jgi:arylsulfatase A-like enzyme